MSSATATGSDAPATSPPPSSRWAFLDAYIEEWFCSLMFAEAPTSTVADPRFDTFLVHLPSTSLDAEGDTTRRRLRYAAELVAYMLLLDSDAWWYARRRERPWFGKYDPSQYDPLSLVPKITFAGSRVLQRADEEPGAVRLLHKMLIPETEIEDAEYNAYAAAKRRILEVEDVNRRLRGFRIPTQLRLQPALPQTAEELRSYLQDVQTLVRALRSTSDTPFRLDAVAVNVYAAFLSDVHTELRELLALDVPVTISLRHCVTGGFIPDTMEWTSETRANVYPVFAQNPSLCHDHAVDEQEDFGHTLDSKWITNSTELWSAVAFAPALRKVRVQPADYDNPRYFDAVARSMGFALARCASLRSLEIVRFRMTEEELDAFEAVLQDPIPARLRSGECSGEESTEFKLVRLKPDAVLTCKPGGELNGYSFDENEENERKEPERRTLAQLNIPSDWQFPVVRTLEATEAIDCIVPGHAICSVPLSSVESWHDAPLATRSELPETNLTSLVIHNEVYDEGVTARFVRLVGRNLRELRWYGEFMGGEDGLELQRDLDEIAAACPLLESLAVEETQLTSLESLVALPLRELALVNTLVPMAALVAFFQALADKSAPITQSLQQFTYHCPRQQLTVEGVDAAIAMLGQNTRLYSVSLGLLDELFEAQHARFEPLKNVRVTIERLPLASKLAFLSVVQHEQQDAASPIGALDNRCVTKILQCLGRGAARRIRLLREEQ